ncbi:hypothetical protein [Paraflavitalea speifideaquila]|uniref:hypothetical protein n=1 Tax=Paraflavitalea speifideaquila TaxID=3076558 RepID=UPI0028E5ADB3|nr:hypothetical protein [Paraflavitalea speifideiaquila]
MKCKPLFVVALVLKSMILLAQAPSDANFAPLSGTANAANQQANAGINLYTGTPNVSFPYTNTAAPVDYRWL